MYRTEMITGDLSSGFLPCTPNGCIKLIEKSGVKVNYFENSIEILSWSKSPKGAFPALGINDIQREKENLTYRGRKGKFERTHRLRDWRA